MYFLTYSSKASELLSDKALKMELKSILNNARIRNSRENITGLLLFRSRNFFQLLEGPKKSVLTTFQKISKDQRHEKLEIISEIEIEGAPRIFPSWQMGFISSPLAVPEQEKLMQTLHSIALAKKVEKEKILALLRTFSGTLPSSAREMLAQTTSLAKEGDVLDIRKD
ncbi:MAG: BLUF domain-containing protein [Bdellovibrionia bacterium]